MNTNITPATAAAFAARAENTEQDVQERGAYVNIGAARDAAEAEAASYNKTQQAAENAATEYVALVLTDAERTLYKRMVERRVTHGPWLMSELFSRAVIDGLVRKGLAVYIRRATPFIEQMEYAEYFALPFGPVHQAGMPDEFNFPEVR